MMMMTCGAAEHHFASSVARTCWSVSAGRVTVSAVSCGGGSSLRTARRTEPQWTRVDLARLDSTRQLNARCVVAARVLQRRLLLLSRRAPGRRSAQVNEVRRCV